MHIVFYMKECGISEAKPFAKPPGGQSGKYSRKLKTTLSFADSDDLYRLDMPGHRKMELERATHSLDILPLHEQLNSHAKDCGDIEAQLQDLKDRDALPAIYTSHPVVTANAGETVPCFPSLLMGFQRLREMGS